MTDTDIAEGMAEAMWLSTFGPDDRPLMDWAEELDRDKARWRQYAKAAIAFLARSPAPVPARCLVRPQPTVTFGDG